MSKLDFMSDFLHSSHLVTETTALPNQTTRHSQTVSAAHNIVSMFIDGKSKMPLQLSSIYLKYILIA